MKWVLNKQKGTIINHPAAGKMEGLVAYEVEDNIADQMKHVINVVVFDRVEPKRKEKLSIVSTRIVPKKGTVKKKNGSDISPSIS